MSSTRSAPSSIHTIVDPSSADGACIDPSFMSDFLPGTFELEFTADKGLTVYQLPPHSSDTEPQREKIFGIQVIGSDDDSVLKKDPTPLSLGKQQSLLDTLICRHKGNEREKELLANVRFTILHERILEQIEAADPNVVEKAYNSGALAVPTGTHVWGAVDKAREKSSYTISYDPARVRRLIWAIVQVVPATKEVLETLDMDALLLSAREEAAPVEATANTPALDAMPL